MTTLKEDVESMKKHLREVTADHLQYIQKKHGVGISRIEPVLLDNQVVGGNKECVLGEINVEVDV